MWSLACERCGTFISVHGDPEEYDRLIVCHVMWRSKGRPCFTHGCGGSLVSVSPMWGIHARTRLELDPQQLFRALCGGGTPEELRVPVEAVRAFLLSAKINKVDAHEMMGDGRTIVDRLYLDNGLILHFAGTAAGAMVFKVTRDAQARDQVGVRPETEDGALRREAQGLPAEAGPIAGDAAMPGRHLPGGHDGLDAGGGERVPDELPHGRGSGHQDTACEPVSRGTEDDGASAVATDGVDP